MKSKSGFSIVEVTIVVAVVAILASIGTIAYLAVQREARDSKRESNITILAEALEKYYEQNGEYPSCTMLSASPDTISTDTLPGIQTGIFKAPQADSETANSIICSDLTEGTDAYAYLGDGTVGCNIGAACQGWVLRYKKETGGTTEVKSRHGSDLAGHDAADPSLVIVNGSPIQNVTSTQCNNLDIFTGANTDAVRTVTDARGSTTRTYSIAKLADSKCWMLDNLKLGDSSSITLTPSDTDISSNVTLPALQTSGSPVHDSLRVYGPVSGDTGSGTTNYGYLYNFTGATAGATRASLPAGNGNAPSSICPAGWRLPTGRNQGSGNPGDYAQLDIAFGGSGNYHGGNGPSQSKWKAVTNGPFRGTFNGAWWGGWGGFFDQGSYSRLWTSSAHSSNASYAMYTQVAGSVIVPGEWWDDRQTGFAVRCVLR